MDSCHCVPLAANNKFPPQKAQVPAETLPEEFRLKLEEFLEKTLKMEKMLLEMVRSSAKQNRSVGGLEPSADTWTSPEAQKLKGLSE